MGSAYARDVFIEVLDRVRARYYFDVLGYVVMPEHFHCMITEHDRADPSVVMKVLRQTVARKLLTNGADHFWQKLWSAAGQQLLRSLPLEPWAARRRDDLLQLLAMLQRHIGLLDEAVKEKSQLDKMAQLLKTQPGVGPITSLAFVLTIGDVSRFQNGKQIASYLGLIPREHSSAGKQGLGGISKQSNRMLRMLLVEAAQMAVRSDPEFRKQYLHRCHSKPKAVAKVAAARKLAVRLYWMLRTQTPYPEIVRIESSPRVPPGRRELDR